MPTVSKMVNYACELVLESESSGTTLQPGHDEPGTLWTAAASIGTSTQNRRRRRRPEVLMGQPKTQVRSRYFTLR